MPTGIREMSLRCVERSGDVVELASRPTWNPRAGEVGGRRCVVSSVRRRWDIDLTFGDWLSWKVDFTSLSYLRQQWNIDGATPPSLWLNYRWFPRMVDGCSHTASFQT